PLVFSGGGRGLAEAAGVARAGRGAPGVRSATPFVLQQALFPTEGGGSHGGLVRGVALQDPAVLDDLKRQVNSGSLAPLIDGKPSILLGIELARTLGVVAGDSITVISPKGAITAVGRGPEMRRLSVAGTVQVGMYEYDASIAYLGLDMARDFADLPAGVTGLEVKLDDPFDAKRVGAAIAGRLGFPFWIRDWMDMNRNLFAALQLEKLALFVIVTIIVLVAAFAIIGHLVLLVAEKRKEIGVLKAIGASAASITAGFFLGRKTIGVVWRAAGSAVGLAIIWIQNTYKIIKLAGDVYQIDYLPMKLAFGDFVLIISATLLLSFLATIVPARRAGALAPVDVLRYE